LSQPFVLDATQPNGVKYNGNNLQTVKHSNTRTHTYATALRAATFCMKWIAGERLRGVAVGVHPALHAVEVAAGAF
jgi:hypothetical protein